MPPHEARDVWPSLHTFTGVDHPRPIVQRLSLTTGAFAACARCGSTGMFVAPPAVRGVVVASGIQPAQRFRRVGTNRSGRERPGPTRARGAHRDRETRAVPRVPWRGSGQAAVAIRSGIPERRLDWAVGSPSCSSQARADTDPRSLIGGCILGDTPAQIDGLKLRSALLAVLANL